MPALPLQLAPEVQAALHERRAVVALESTLLAHGLPAERRPAAAAALSNAVRSQGAVPALVAIVEGRARVGLSELELERFLASEPAKASLPDLAVALASGGHWATTVATTMALASRAGVRAFATGGIGGVHREVLDTFDESSDLTALSRYPVLVVSAGAKAILDLARTMERLETLGVPVIGWRTSELPAFYHGHSGIALRHRVGDAAAIAAIAAVRFDQLGEGGILLVQPPPAHLAQDPDRVEGLIRAVLADAREREIRGAALTPFLLAALDRASAGSVVDTNLALVTENARLAAEVAVALSRARS
ncbi:MAG: pseudouridine-5'-phosphate glycosidase [Deltaproteobacteria bacterium]|nr:pseudouridine-5'-phosphate glycosidase [Deltaproteobacteria bacterium]